MSVSTPSGPVPSPVRFSFPPTNPHTVPPRHRAEMPLDPAFPDYPFFLDHDAEARARHLYGRGPRRWGKHPGFPALDDSVHLPASAPGRRQVAEMHPVGRLGVVALTAAALVTAAAWVVAVTAPSRELVAVLTLGWAVGYLAGCMWLDVAHGNAVALAPGLQYRRRSRWVWLGWFVPLGALWIPKRIVDDTMWTTARYALQNPVRWTGLWWTSFVSAALLWAGSVVLAQVSPERVPDVLGGFATLDAGLRVGAAVACSIALLLWVPIVRRMAIIADRLADARRSTLVR